ncbi:MAG: (2Fe-2S)-binding protein [Chlorobium sp.]|nr:2Fe-2S iron-sulfur cluster-binding protein [Chlorobium phaeovibrioides]NQU45608.1 (2Fe-2S)-binding protein [Chlorobium sp.]
MKITINSIKYSAKEGDRLLDIARQNHAHIGYFCGGNALCQTCYTRITEGAELLSPLNDIEQEILSPNLIQAGTRLACQATIEKPGTITMVSAIEEVKQMTQTTPLQLPLYMGIMGWEAAVMFPRTIAMQIGRILEGKLDLEELGRDMTEAIREAAATVFRLILPTPGESLKEKDSEGHE